MSELIGREKEIVQLDIYLQKFLSGAGRIVFITGPQGVGKTVLVENFLDSVRKTYPNLFVAKAECHSSETDTAFSPFNQVLNLLLSTKDSKGRIVVSNKFKKFMLEYSPDIAKLIPVFGTIVSSMVKVSMGVKKILFEKEDDIREESDENRILEQYTGTLFKVAEQTPIILFFDNFEFADDSSAKLLSYIGRRVEGHRVLILVSYDKISDKEHRISKIEKELQSTKISDSLDISRLSKDDVMKIIDSRYSPNDFSRESKETLAEFSNNNPLVVDLYLSNLRDSGKVVFSEGKWHLIATVSEVKEMPRSIHELCEKRAEQLGEKLKEILTLASVEGIDFTAQVLANISKVEELQMINYLIEQLQKTHQIAFEKEEKRATDKTIVTIFEFADKYFREYLYGSLSTSQKRLLHKNIADCLERIYEKNIYRISTSLAYHYREAKEYQKAIRYYYLSAQKHKEIQANNEAVKNYETILHIIDEMKIESEVLEKETLLLESKVLNELGDIHKRIGNWELAEEKYNLCLKKSDNNLTKCWALDGLGDIARLKQNLIEAEQKYCECKKNAQKLKNKEIIIEVETDLVELYFNFFIDCKAKEDFEKAEKYKKLSLCQN